MDEPGPATYDINSRNLMNKSYTMGLKLKVPEASDKVPGPGQYNIEKSFDCVTNGGTGKFSGRKWGFSK